MTKKASNSRLKSTNSGVIGKLDIKRVYDYVNYDLLLAYWIKCANGAFLQHNSLFKSTRYHLIYFKTQGFRGKEKKI